MLGWRYTRKEERMKSPLDSMEVLLVGSEFVGPPKPESMRMGSFMIIAGVDHSLAVRAVELIMLEESFRSCELVMLGSSPSSARILICEGQALLDLTVAIFSEPKEIHLFVGILGSKLDFQVSPYGPPTYKRANSSEKYAKPSWKEIEREMNKQRAALLFFFRCILRLEGSPQRSQRCFHFCSRRSRCLHESARKRLWSGCGWRLTRGVSSQLRRSRKSPRRKMKRNDGFLPVRPMRERRSILFSYPNWKV